MRSLIFLGFVVCYACGCHRFDHEAMVVRIDTLEREYLQAEVEKKAAAERLLKTIEEYELTAPTSSHRFLKHRRTLALFRLHSTYIQSGEYNTSNGILGKIRRILSDDTELSHGIGWAQQDRILDRDAAINFIEMVDDALRNAP